MCRQDTSNDFSGYKKDPRKDMLNIDQFVPRTTQQTFFRRPVSGTLGKQILEFMVFPVS